MVRKKDFANKRKVKEFDLALYGIYCGNIITLSRRRNTIHI